MRPCLLWLSDGVKQLIKLLGRNLKRFVFFLLDLGFDHR